MKVIKSGLILLVPLALMFGCASVEFRSTAREPLVKNTLEGRTVGIEPFPVRFSSKHFTIDLRDVKISINGQPVILQDKYLKIYDDSELGKAGILEANFLRLTGADSSKITHAVTAAWKAGLSGTRDYHLGFFNGLGEGNMGEISNRPLVYDQSVYPMQVTYASAAGPLSYFSRTELLPSQSVPGGPQTDFVLRGSLDISNEVVEIISVPEEITRNATNFGETPPKPGEYHIIMSALFNFELIDTATGKAVVTDATDGGFFVNTSDTVDVRLPVKNGDGKAFEAYFARTDFTPYAVEAAEKCMARFYHLMAPFYTTSSYTVKEKN